MILTGRGGERRRVIGAEWAKPSSGEPRERFWWLPLGTATDVTVTAGIDGGAAPATEAREAARLLSGRTQSSCPAGGS
ncbi:hypothetical protein [Streptomyces sp. NPDC060002]|uniref:hypothetical protein n=1 Tax=Streptomyces sp. NPDC060002 TaxID=3347033 RepID=UPI0036A44879